MSRKKLLLIGFILIILIAIPLTIFLIRQQQELRSRAEKATTISFEPVSTTQSPIQKNTEDTVNFDIIVDPGTNQNLVSFVRLEILYDPNKLATGGATPQERPFVEESGVLTLLEGPIFTPGKIAATLSVGVDPTKVIQTKTKIATLTLKAVNGTGGTPTEISFGPATQVLSAGAQDEANENVLAGAESAFVAIAGEVTEPSITISPSVSPGDTSPSPSVTATPSLTPPVSSSPTATITPSPTGGVGQSTNVPPVCSALAVDRATTGTAPFSITFNASGTDSDGTVSRVTFSYGDGEVQNVTQGGGIGTSTVNASSSHTYQNAGTYTASVVLTDNIGGVSSGTCSQTITVTNTDGSSSSVAPTESTALPAAGPGDVILGAGAVIGLFTLLGAFFFFAL